MAETHRHRVVIVGGGFGGLFAARFLTLKTVGELRDRMARVSGRQGRLAALAVVGEMQKAKDMLERLLRIASPLGLYAEEFEVVSARHLGNFPQAFSHLALIEAVGRIIVAERLEENSL